MASESVTTIKIEVDDADARALIDAMRAENERAAALATRINRNIRRMLWAWVALSGLNAALTIFVAVSR